MKSDIQATRFTAATSTVIIAPSIRLRGIIVASNGSGAGSVILKTKASGATGTVLFQADVPNGDVINLNFPEDGILFPQGLYTTTLTNVAAVTLLTDKYSGPGPRAQNSTS